MLPSVDGSRTDVARRWVARWGWLVALLAAALVGVVVALLPEAAGGQLADRVAVASGVVLAVCLPVVAVREIRRLRAPARDR